MDSFLMYRKFRKDYSSNRAVTCVQKMNDTDFLIRQICNEIFSKSLEMEDASLICEVLQIAEQMESGVKVRNRKVELLDAWILLQGVLEYINNPGFTARSFSPKMLESLFAVEEPEKGQGKRLKDVKCILEKLNRKMETEKQKRYFSSKRVFEADKIKTQPSGYIEKKEEGHTMVSHEGKQQPAGDEERKKQDRFHVQAWHEEQNRIRGKLEEMQPSVRQLLQDFMSFSDTVTEQYVLQFAKMQIEIFNRIADIYAYHKVRAQSGGNCDYVNAVNNYHEIMLDLIETLSVFGVEEICSSPGARFEGGIHEPDIQSFSTKDARIEESIRKGFQYKNIVIQKEKVRMRR